MYTIVFSEEAVYQLKKLDNKTAARILERAEKALDNPARYFKRLAGREEYKLRVGDYRIIANISHNDKIVFIRSVGHRKQIYKR